MMAVLEFRPGCSVAVGNGLLSTEWTLASLLIQIIKVPGWTVTSLGTKPLAVIWMVAVTGLDTFLTDCLFRVSQPISTAKTSTTPPSSQNGLECIILFAFGVS